MKTETQYPVPVVRLIIPDARGKVLILKRQKAKYASGAWCLPGGKIGYGKTIEDAIAQELREETSLLCVWSKFLFYQDNLPLEPGKMHCINLYFECGVKGTVVLNEESTEYAWIGPSELEKYNIAFKNDLALIRYWKESKN